MVDPTTDPTPAPGTTAAGEAPAAGPPPADTAAAASTASEVAPTEPGTTAEVVERKKLTIRELLEAGVHFGHQTSRWDPRMRPYIFGERNGIHIIDLDRTLPLMEEALAAVRDTVAAGGKILFVGTKRQAQAPIRLEAERAGQFYVNNRWLGGMLTNFRTVKKSIDRFKELLEILEDEEKVAELSKKELARIHRAVEKYRKSLEGIREMGRIPDMLFIVDVGKEHIAVSEAERLGIPVVAVVDTNCNPEPIDYVIPGNDDATRAIQLYCARIADACIEGQAIFQARVQSERPAEGAAPEEVAPATGRKVVEIQQPPRRGRGGRRQAGGAVSVGGRRSEEEVPATQGPPPPEAPAPGTAGEGA